MTTISGRRMSRKSVVFDRSQHSFCVIAFLVVIRYNDIKFNLGDAYEEKNYL